MVSIRQVNGTGRSLNMIQHERLAFRRQTFIEPLLYIYIYMYVSGIYAAVDFSTNMTYSGTGTMLHLTSLTLDTSSPPHKLLDATSDTYPRCWTISGITKSWGWYWWYQEVVYQFVFALSEKKGSCEDNTFLRNEATWLMALWQTQLWLHQIRF